MIVKGVQLSALPAQFEGCVEGRTLILDGDGPAYRVAATVKRLDTAIRRFQQDMLTQMFITQSHTVRVHLTASASTKAARFSVLAAKPYQGNRKSKTKPALLEPLREAMTMRENWLPEFEFVKMHTVIEADDGMMHDAYSLKDSGVIWSDDKDLRMTPYPYYEDSTGKVMPGEKFGKLWLSHTPAGQVKLLGQGPLFFWAQMLMGDTADNIQGVKTYAGRQCGPVGAYEVLRDCSDCSDAANRVIGAYRAINQNPLAEGWLLWLQRNPDDNVWEYLKELDLSAENREFVNDCVQREWFKKAYAS